MANYYARARSNYFKVKAPEAFRAFCEKFGLVYFDKETSAHGTLCGFYTDGSVPWDYYYDEDSDEYVDFDFTEELATHLEDGWIAEVREIGFEKMRYLVGFTAAIAASGEVAWVNLDHITDRVRQAFPGANFTACAY